MSKLFFDNLINFDEIEKEIKKISSNIEEKEEFYELVDGIVNHQVIEKVLDKLPEEHHQGFLVLLHKCPHDEVVILEYIKGKTGRDVEKELQADLKGISADILKELMPGDEITNEVGVSKK